MKSVPFRFLFVFFAFLIASVSLRAQSQYSIYFGDIHSQTWYSDGNQDQSGYPNVTTLAGTYPQPVARAMTYARNNTNGTVNFWGVSDHNHHSGLNMTIP